MDDFRKEQKIVSHNAGKREHPHGCPCCRKHADISKHKKYARKIARVRLNRKPLEE